MAHGDDTSTWRKLIAEEMETQQDPGPIVYNTLTETEMDVEFDDGFGSAEGVPFTCWTERRVYMPKEYDGAESVISAPRNPCNEKQDHK